MVVSNTGKVQGGAKPDNDRKGELKAFDDSKIDVKGLIDAGVSKVPRIFIHQQQKLDKKSDASESHCSTPIIDLKGINNDVVLRTEIVNKVRNSCGEWGFFQVVDHGIPESVLDEMISGINIL